MSKNASSTSTVYYLLALFSILEVFKMINRDEDTTKWNVAKNFKNEKAINEWSRWVPGVPIQNFMIEFRTLHDYDTKNMNKIYLIYQNEPDGL